MSLVHSFVAGFHQVNQEPGANPGSALKPLTAILYFVGAPVALFLVIAGVVALLSTKKNSTNR